MRCEASRSILLGKREAQGQEASEVHYQGCFFDTIIFSALLDVSSSDCLACIPNGRTDC
jgi:hypothetical protein